MSVASGLTATGSQLWSPDSSGVAGTGAAGRAALAAGADRVVAADLATVMLHQAGPIDDDQTIRDGV